MKLIFFHFFLAMMKNVSCSSSRHIKKKGEAAVKKVSDILKSKSYAGIYSVTPDTVILDAVRLMSDKSIGALLVMENGRLAGIITERDYTRKVVLKARSSQTALVREIMTAVAFTVSPDQTMESCMEIMTENRVRHLPVIDEGNLVGLISIGDLVKNIIEDQKEMITQLEKYIRGEIS